MAFIISNSTPRFWEDVDIFSIMNFPKSGVFNIR